MSKELISDILKSAKQLGTTQAEVAFSKISGFDVTVRLGEVESVQHAEEQALAITVYFGNKSGTATSTDLSAKSVQLTLEKACYIARFTEEDPCSGLADAELMAYGYPDLDLFHEWDIDSTKAIEMAKQCEAQAFAFDKRISNSEGAHVSAHRSFSWYGNSHGFVGGYPVSEYAIDIALLAEQGEDKQRDYDYTVARDPAALEELNIVAQRAVRRTVDRLGAKTLSTRSCPVIFAADVAKSLIASFISAISGGSLYRKASFLLNQLGQQVFPDFITIDERPHIKKARGSAPFDAEGVATKAKSIIAAGVLQSYILGSYSARKLNMQTTANAGGVHNIFVSTSECDLSGLVKMMGTGLLVTELIGQGVNIVTGDYSRGAFGYWVENGKIMYPVHQITIAGNLKDIFRNIVAIANDVDRRGNINTGSVLVDKLMIAG